MQEQGIEILSSENISPIEELDFQQKNIDY